MEPTTTTATGLSTAPMVSTASERTETSMVQEAPCLGSPSPIASAMIVGGFLAICVIGSLSSTSSASNENQTGSSTQAAQDVTAIALNSTAIAQDNQTVTSAQTTATTIPTVSAAELETTYKASTTDTTIATLDKDGNADQGKDVHFTCTILNFVKDSSGNTDIWR